MASSSTSTTTKSKSKIFDESSDFDESSEIEDSQNSGIDIDDSEYLCNVCEHPGLLLICDMCEKMYHFECVGLTAKPKERHWYCPQCEASNEKENEDDSEDSEDIFQSPKTKRY